MYSGEYDACDVTLSYPTVVRHIFNLARCGYTLRVTSQASYSPEYIIPTQKKSCSQMFSLDNVYISNAKFFAKM
jgi:hypothetical protein